MASRPTGRFVSRKSTSASRTLTSTSHASRTTNLRLSNMTHNTASTAAGIRTRPALPRFRTLNHLSDLLHDPGRVTRITRLRANTGTSSTTIASTTGRVTRLSTRVPTATVTSPTANILPAVSSHDYVGEVLADPNQQNIPRIATPEFIDLTQISFSDHSSVNRGETDSAMFDDSTNRRNSLRSSRSFLVCPVCYHSSEEKKMATTQCGHVFCINCIMCCELCPLCQQPILPGSFIALFI